MARAIFPGVMLVAAAPTPMPASVVCTPLATLPDAHGFAGMFAGVCGGALLAGGGANFPEKPPWDGGTKKWYGDVFALERPDAQWHRVGTLPRPLAYGICVSVDDGVVCAGGGDAARNYADAFRLKYRAGRLQIEPLPPLPTPLANACAAAVGKVLYVGGGQTSPDAAEASAAVFAIDLSVASPRWTALVPCPGGARILPVAAAFDGAFWMIGGAMLKPDADGKVVRTYLSDGYRYDSQHGWSRIADLPHPLVACPSPAPTDRSGIYLLGGDDGSQAAVPAQRRHGFIDQALRFDPVTHQWTSAGAYPPAAVTAPAVPWQGGWVICSGEVRPGIRSPRVWSWRTSVGG